MVEECKGARIKECFRSMKERGVVFSRAETCLENPAIDFYEYLHSLGELFLFRGYMLTSF